MMSPDVSVLEKHGGAVVFHAFKSPSAVHPSISLTSEMPLEAGNVIAMAAL
jgi:hypothetical protein